jgi:hypothetical protein
VTLRNLVRVKSSYIHSLGYMDGEATVRFVSGLVRNYRMPVTKFQKWINAPSEGRSIGRFFNDNVKRKYSSGPPGRASGLKPARVSSKSAESSIPGREPEPTGKSEVIK